MPKKVLLVGGGITSALIGNILRSDFENINLSLWEKLSEAGGRFNTITGGKNNELLVDLGAQYITTSEENIKNYDRIYSDLFLNNLITLMETRVKGMRHLSENKKNYIVPLGMKSIVDNFLSHAKFNSICYGQKLSKLHIRSDKWNAVTETGKEELFDVVILTIPVPEILKLTGDLESLLFNNLVREHLSAVEYSSRFALGLFFDKGVFTEWDAEYIDDDSVLRYTANDSWKAHGEPKFKSAVIHTTIQFGEKYKENDLMQVKKIINKHVQKVFKHWPEPSSTVICQWSYSQVFKPYYSKPGSVILNEKPLLIAGGDGFIGSTFDDCIFSAKTICNLLSNNYCGK